MAGPPGAAPRYPCHRLSRRRTARREELLAVGALVWAAALFGTSFVVVKDALDDMRPVPYLACRFLLAALVFAVLARGRPGRPGELRLAVQAGVTYAVANVCQTIGLERTTPATAAFLTYLLVVAVPVLQFVLAGIRPGADDGRRHRHLGGRPGPADRRQRRVRRRLPDHRRRRGALRPAHHPDRAAAAARYDVIRFNALQIAVVAAVLCRSCRSPAASPPTASSWLVIVYAAIVVTVLTFLPWMWAQRRLPPDPRRARPAHRARLRRHLLLRHRRAAGHRRPHRGRPHPAGGGAGRAVGQPRRPRQ